MIPKYRLLGRQDWAKTHAAGAAELGRPRPGTCCNVHCSFLSSCDLGSCRGNGDSKTRSHLFFHERLAGRGRKDVKLGGLP